jgi:hypothetical protein
MYAVSPQLCALVSALQGDVHSGPWWTCSPAAVKFGAPFPPAVSSAVPPAAFAAQHIKLQVQNCEIFWMPFTQQNRMQTKAKSMQSYLISGMWYSDITKCWRRQSTWYQALCMIWLTRKLNRCWMSTYFTSTTILSVCSKAAFYEDSHITPLQPQPHQSTSSPTTSVICIWIVFPSIPRSSMWFLLIRFPELKFCMHISSRPSHSPWFDYPNI